MSTITDQESYHDIKNNFRGYVKIRLEHLNFGTASKYMTRSLDSSTVAGLVKDYKDFGCLKLDPRHYVRAIISRDTFHCSLEKSKLEKKDLIKIVDQVEEPQFLELPDDIRLQVVTGHHRLVAADHFLSDKWWTVELFEDTLSPTTLLAFQETDLYAHEYCGGDKLRNRRLHQKLGNHTEELKWASTFKKNERQSFNYLYKPKVTALGKVFDRLLPIAGLWTDLPLGSLHSFLYMRCSEELISYVNHMSDVWEWIFGDRHDLKSLTDTTTVRELQALSPRFSLRDHSRIRRLMDELIIFPALSRSEDRAALLSRLQSVPGRIPSFYGFKLDAWYLQSCSVILRELLPATAFGSTRQCFLGAHHKSPQSKLQTSGSTVTAVRYSSGHKAAAAAYFQLNLFVMREGTIPRNRKRKHMGQLRNERWWRSLAQLASDLGFNTSEIRSILSRDINQQYVFSSSNLKAVSPKSPQVIKKPKFTTNANELTQRQRCGQPEKEILEGIRPYLFLDVMYSDIPVQPKQYATALAMHTDIVRAFFGDLGDLRYDSAYIESESGTVRLSEEPDWSVVQISQALRPASSLYSTSGVEDNREQYDMQLINIYAEDSLLAPGFEMDLPKPMEIFHSLPDPRSTSEIVNTFLGAEEKPFVLFNYHDRKYAKYSGSRLEALEKTLESLAREDQMFVIFLENNGLMVLGYDGVLKADAAQKTKLIFVGRRGQWYSEYEGNQTHEGFVGWIDMLGCQNE